MRLANETVTLFNSKLDIALGYDVLHGTVISGVSWYGRGGAGVTSNGYRSSTDVTVRIPVDADFGGREYVSPLEWNGAEDVTGKFTFKPDDFIVRGEIPTEGMTRAQVFAAGFPVMTILTVTDNRRALNAKHWHITGV